VIGSRLFTLLVLDQGARLLDAAGEVLLELGPDGRGQALRAALPARAHVQLILAGSGLAVQCVESPFLDPREQAEVQRRMVRSIPGPEPLNAGAALDPDPQAEGGHVLWLASHPRREMDDWLEVLAEAGARPVAALPWQRALLAASPRDEAHALHLTLEPGAGRLLFFRGRSLRFTRVFPLPAALDQRPWGPDATREFCRVAGEELALLLQFIQQKQRGVALTTLFTVGLGPGPGAEVAAMAQGLGLALESLGPELPAFLLAGAARERQRKGWLDLVPAEVREARRRRVLRTVVWASALGMALVGAGAKGFLIHGERQLRREAVRAEEALAHRREVMRQGEEAARLRFGLLRVRQAEARQRLATEQLERLGLSVFQVPDGVELQKVEISQVPGDRVQETFQLDGSARTQGGFSLGNLAQYYDHLAEHPGTKLDPLREVTVADQGAGDPAGPAPAQAVTRFHLGGTAP
jgi:hypothetical protein